MITIIVDNQSIAIIEHNKVKKSKISIESESVVRLSEIRKVTVSYFGRPKN